MQYAPVGSVNERGLLSNLTRMGFNIAQGVTELIANSIDAGARIITCIQEFDTICIIDDGDGMDYNGINNMFDISRSNHTEDRSMGVAGIGANAAFVICGKKTTIEIYTKRVGDNNYTHITVPIGVMYEQGKYVDMITITHMTDTEIDRFNQDRPHQTESNTYSGTTIQIENNTELSSVIKRSFIHNNSHHTEDQFERMGVTFGRFNTDIYYKDNVDTPLNDPIRLMKYNYFEGADIMYYQNKQVDTISMWKHGNTDRFIREDQLEGVAVYYELKKAGTGYTKNEKLIRNLEREMVGWTNVCDITVTCGLRKDTAYFDPTTPPLELSSRQYAGPYDTEHLTGDIGDICSFSRNPTIIRNGQSIGKFTIPDSKENSARGDSVTRLYSLIHTDVSYHTYSTEDSIIDAVIGIQANKNQFNGKHLPINLTRLVKNIRDKKAKAIHTYFTDTMQRAHAEADVQPVAEADVQPVAEADVQPLAEADVQPVAEADVQPLAEADVQPATEADVQPAAEADVQPLAEPDVQPLAEADVQPLAEPDTPRVRRPVNVMPHRREGVYKHEMVTIISKYMEFYTSDAQIDDFMYTDTNIVRSYNLINDVLG
jgi:hypothetical protein